MIAVVDVHLFLLGIDGVNYGVSQLFMMWEHSSYISQ